MGINLACHHSKSFDTFFWGVGQLEILELVFSVESFSGNSDQQLFVGAKKPFVGSVSCYILADYSSLPLNLQFED